MYNTRYLGILILIGVLVGGVGCATAGGSVSHATATSAKVAIDAAEAARKKAASVGGEWRDTGKIIKKAKKAEKAGDFVKAIKLADQARMQGENGYKQMLAQKDLRMPAFFK